jgi:MinD-like ATPase involved in chromosome partitioning or flagellar assembly
MALANIGCLLAGQLSSDNKVLMIDWDLEAPGLHQYFKDRISHADYRDPQAAEKMAPGLIDLLLQLNEKTPAEPPRSGLDEEHYAEQALSGLQFGDYVMATHEPNLFLMKAGRFDEEYADKTSTFDWEGLYSRSPMLFFSLAQKLAEDYNYVLIDSRTGLTDTSGICTMLMPEKLILVFTPNRQSLTGVLELVRNATEYRRQSEDLRPLMVFPLPSRIEASEPKRREIWRLGDEHIEGYEPLFENAFKEVYGLKDCPLGRYFDDVQVQHAPQYAYGEEIAVLNEKRSDKLSLTRTYQTFLEKMVFADSPWDEVADTTITEYAAELAATKSQLKDQETQHKKSRNMIKILSFAGILVVLVIAVLSYSSWQNYQDNVAVIEATLNDVGVIKDRLEAINKETEALASLPRNADYPYDTVGILIKELNELQPVTTELSARSDSEFVQKEIDSVRRSILSSLDKLDKLGQRKNLRIPQQAITK